MNKTAVILILLSFLGVAVFGFVAMNSVHGDTRVCLAEVTNPAGCGEGSYIGVYQGFSAGIITALAALVLALGLLLAGVIRAEFLNDYLVFEKTAVVQPEIKRHIVEWLETRFKRDPAAKI